MKKIIVSMFILGMIVFGVSINAETNIYPNPNFTAEKSITLDQKNVNVNLNGFNYNLETETTGITVTELYINPYNLGYNNSAKFEKLVIPYFSGSSKSNPDGIVGVKVTCDCKLKNEDNWTYNAVIAKHFFSKPGEDFVLTKQEISDLFDDTYDPDQTRINQVGQDLPNYISLMFYITDGKTIEDVPENDYQVLSSNDKPIVMTYGLDYNTTLYEDTDKGYLGNSQIYIGNYSYQKYKDGEYFEGVGKNIPSLFVPYNTTKPDIKILNPVKEYYQPGDELELEFTLKNVKDFKNYKLWLETVADGLVAVDGAGGAITEANWSGDKDQFSTDLKDANGWLLIKGEDTIKFTKKFKISEDYDKDALAINSIVKYEGADTGNAGNTLTIKLGENKPGTEGPGEVKPLPETGSTSLTYVLILLSVSLIGVGSSVALSKLEKQL